MSKLLPARLAELERLLIQQAEALRQKGKRPMEDVR